MHGHSRVCGCFQDVGAHALLRTLGQHQQLVGGMVSIRKRRNPVPIARRRLWMGISDLVTKRKSSQDKLQSPCGIRTILNFSGKLQRKCFGRILVWTGSSSAMESKNLQYTMRLVSLINLYGFLFFSKTCLRHSVVYQLGFFLRWFLLIIGHYSMYETMSSHQYTSVLTCLWFSAPRIKTRIGRSITIKPSLSSMYKWKNSVLRIIQHSLIWSI